MFSRIESAESAVIIMDVQDRGAAAAPSAQIEAVLFDWLRFGATEQFKAVAKLLRESPENLMKLYAPPPEDADAAPISGVHPRVWSVEAARPAEGLKVA